MKRSRFTEEQITYALRQVEAGTPVEDMCRHMGCSWGQFLSLEEALRQHGCFGAVRAAAIA